MQSRRLSTPELCVALLLLCVFSTWYLSQEKPLKTEHSVSDVAPKQVPTAPVVSAPNSEQNVERLPDSTPPPASGKIENAEQGVEKTPCLLFDESDKDSSPIPAAEGDWGKELRELKELAVKNPEAALEKVVEIQDKEERESATKEVCLQIANIDPAFAMDAAWNLGLGQEGGLSEMNALETIAEQWAMVDAPSAINWACGQPVDAEGCRDRIVQGIILALSENTPETAAHLVANQMRSDEQAQYNTALALLTHWSTSDWFEQTSYLANAISILLPVVTELN